MRIVQLIDSLEAGGAERMAVNYANALAEEIPFSALVATRKEGALKKQLAERVDYLFLNKKNKVDFQAIVKFRKYLIKNQIQIIHAHSSSFFLAVLTKLSLPRVKIIWHNHYGNRINETRKENYILFLCSFLFSACFAVNPELQQWILKNLRIRKVFFVPNFIVELDNIDKKTYLKGESNKRIVCLANLKKPKNHITVLKAFNELKLYHSAWSLHFVGKIYNDDYLVELMSYINDNNLNKDVFLYDAKEDISFILSQATIAVLASEYEGFPVCLLEYGFAGLPIISTNVGFCSSIIKHGYNGLLFSPFEEEALKKQFLRLTLDNELQNKLGGNIKRDVLKKYSCAEIIKQILVKYKDVINE
ncbi:MAG: glycosyltransferase [Bacteroidota bacterium]